VLITKFTKKIHTYQTACLIFRNAGTLLSRVIVFCIGWGFFSVDTSTKVTRADAQNFMVSISMYFLALRCQLCRPCHQGCSPKTEVREPTRSEGCFNRLGTKTELKLIGNNNNAPFSMSTLRWAVLTVLWIEFCHTGSISVCVDSFVFICVFCFFCQLNMLYYSNSVRWTW